jgi:hypothetical protein
MTGLPLLDISLCVLEASVGCIKFLTHVVQIELQKPLNK